MSDSSSALKIFLYVSISPQILECWYYSINYLLIIHTGFDRDREYMPLLDVFNVFICIQQHTPDCCSKTNVFMWL